MTDSKPETFHPMACFTGLKRVPFLALTRNAINPLLSIEGDAVVIRVIRRTRLAVADLARVTTGRAIGQMVSLEPKAGIRVFSANFTDRDEAIRLLRALDALGAPLDAKARALIAE
ncbi:hypothetical protein L2U69_18565 [Zavarzinia compransoris]|uniref:hypothetical protein n=1 Tax=Zavarzinia marina TaxID=2911065 RepID=UPI001F3FE25B|nr:hypothetical protein [Zavarzinia marina]MCF4167655.1 hypothetical protein [Zavarzinia marina]